MQQEIEILKKQIEELQNWKAEKMRQQISFPIDQTSLRIINENNGKIAVGGIYLSISGTNPAISLGYGTWSIVANNQILLGINSGTGGSTGGAVGNTGGVTTYTVYHWLRTE